MKLYSVTDIVRSTYSSAATPENMAGLRRKVTRAITSLGMEPDIRLGRGKGVLGFTEASVQQIRERLLVIARARDELRNRDLATMTDDEYCDKWHASLPVGRQA